MSTPGQLGNEPIEVEFAGTVRKVKRLTMRQLYAAMEGRIVSREMARIREMASSLDPKEQTAFLASATMAMPKGPAMDALVSEYMSSLDGVVAMLAAAIGVKHSDAEELIEKGDKLGLQSVLSVAMAGLNEKGSGEETPFPGRKS